MIQVADPADPDYSEGVRVLRRLCVRHHLVPESCQVSASDLDFGSAPPLFSPFSDVYAGSMTNKGNVAIKVLRLSPQDLRDVSIFCSVSSPRSPR
jgi:hypothetical protein